MLEHRIDLFQAINSFKKYCEGDLFQNQLSEQISNSNSTSKTQTVIQDPEYYKVLKITKNFEQDRPLWTSKETIKDKWLASQITQFENDFPTGKERGDAVNHFKKLINSGAFVFPDGARACALKFADMMASSASKVNASSEASSSSTTSPTNHLRDAKKEKSQGVNNNNNNNNNNSNNTHIKKKKQ